jgi:hypothetical protein
VKNKLFANLATMAGHKGASGLWVRPIGSRNDLCATDHFFILNVQMVDPTTRNNFHMKSNYKPNLKFLTIFI